MGGTEDTTVNKTDNILYIHRDLLLYVNKCRENERYVGARFCKENSAVGRMKSNRGMGVSALVLVKSSRKVKYTPWRWYLTLGDKFKLSPRFPLGMAGG